MSAGNAVADRLLAAGAAQDGPGLPPPLASRAGKDRPCGICGRKAAEHTRCPVCGDALEHHDGGVTSELEWEGRARMAAAGQVAGRALTDVERQALARYPQPRFLTGDGYRRRAS